GPCTPFSPTSARLPRAAADSDIRTPEQPDRPQRSRQAELGTNRAVRQPGADTAGSAPPRLVRSWPLQLWHRPRLRRDAARRPGPADAGGAGSGAAGKGSAATGTRRPAAQDATLAGRGAAPGLARRRIRRHSPAGAIRPGADDARPD